ncbi:MAG: TIR domain-containing protein [Alphaproteobacteria bacterium]|nr:TIR domain-containing protein [Alphaproteobacteria bacterium]
MSQERLFISHAGEDAERANRIVAHLEARGAPCWVAPRDIPLKSVYAEEITRALQTCKACAVIVSAASNNSAAVKRELELASHYGKPFVPIRIDATEPGPGLDYYLRNTQWLDLRSNEAAALDRLVAHLSSPSADAPAPAARTASSPPPPPPPSSARTRPILFAVGGLTALVALAIGAYAMLRKPAPEEAAADPDAAQYAETHLVGDYNWDGVPCGQGPNAALENGALVFRMPGAETFVHAIVSATPDVANANPVFATQVQQPQSRAGERWELRVFDASASMPAQLTVISPENPNGDVWTRCTPSATAPDSAPPSPPPLINLADADTSWSGIWGDRVSLIWHLKADGRACHFYPHAGNREVCSWRWTQDGTRLSLESEAEVWAGSLIENGTVFSGQMGPKGNPDQRSPFLFTRE